MPRLSIILPVLGPAAQMEDSLVSVLANRPADCEILVVHTQAYSDPYELKDEVCFIEAPRTSRLVDGINLAIAVSRAPVIHLLSCGVEVTEGWAEQGLAALADPQVAAVTPVVLDRKRSQRVLSAGTAYDAWGRVRRLSTRLPLEGPCEPLPGHIDPDLPVAFYRKSALDKVGRLTSKVGDRLACVELGLALEHAGFRCVVAPRCRVTATNRLPNREGGFARGMAAEQMFWRWLPAGSWPKLLPLHGLLVLFQTLLSFPWPSMFTELLGRACGALQWGAHRRHWQALEELQAEALPPALPPEAPHFLRTPHHAAHHSRAGIGERVGDE